MFLSIAIAQEHRVDHQQTLIDELDRHHLQGNSIRVITEIDKPTVSAVWSANRGPLLKAEAAMLDDIARLITAYPMLSCRTSPPQNRRCRSLNSSDNNIRISGHPSTIVSAMCPNKTREKQNLSGAAPIP